MLTFGWRLVISVPPPLGIILALCARRFGVRPDRADLQLPVMQTRTPESMRGRVVGVMTSMTYAAARWGFMLAGPLIDLFGLRATFLVLAVPILLTIGRTVIPALRGTRRGPGSLIVATTHNPFFELASAEVVAVGVRWCGSRSRPFRAPGTAAALFRPYD